MSSARPIILTGPAGARGQAWQSIRRAAKRLGVPALPMESPRGANDPALGGVRGSLARADLVVLIGRKLDFALGFGRPPLFQPETRFLETRANVLVEAAARRIGGVSWRRWSEEVLASTRLGRADWPAIESSDEAPMHPLRLVSAVRKAIRPGDVVVSDGGEFGQWAQAGLSVLEPAPDRVINGPSGAIGAAVPFAIGAKLARPEARVFAFQGDGACGYHIAEFDTAVRRGIPFLLIVGDDGQWNAEVQIQRGLGKPPLDCLRLGSVRYDRVAAAFGAHGELVSRPAELDGAISRALATGRPALVSALIAGVSAPTYQAAH